PESRGFRTDAIVLDQRTRSEIAHTNAPEEAGNIVHGDAGRDDRLDRSRNVIADRVKIRIARFGERKISVQSHARKGRVVVCELDSLAAAGPRRFGRSRVAREDEL